MLWSINGLQGQSWWLENSCTWHYYSKWLTYMFLIIFSPLLWPTLLPMKPQICIQRFKIFAFWYYRACPSKQPCSAISSLSSHQLTSHEVSVHLHASYQGESVMPTKPQWTRCFTPITVQCYHILLFPNSVTGPFLKTFHYIDSSDWSPFLTQCSPHAISSNF